MNLGNAFQQCIDFQSQILWHFLCSASFYPSTSSECVIQYESKYDEPGTKSSDSPVREPHDYYDSLVLLPSTIHTSASILLGGSWDDPIAISRSKFLWLYTNPAWIKQESNKHQFAQKAGLAWLSNFKEEDLANFPSRESSNHAWKASPHQRQTPLVDYE